MAESVYAVVLCLLGAAAMPILTKKYRALLISSQPELKWQSVPPLCFICINWPKPVFTGMEHVRNTSIIISLDSNDSICQRCTRNDSWEKTNASGNSIPYVALQTSKWWSQGQEGTQKEHLDISPVIFPGCLVLIVYWLHLVLWYDGHVSMHISLCISIHICVWIRVLMYLSSQISG